MKSPSGYKPDGDLIFAKVCAADLLCPMKEIMHYCAGVSSTAGHWRPVWSMVYSQSRIS